MSKVTRYKNVTVTGFAYIGVTVSGIPIGLRYPVTTWHFSVRFA